MKKAIIVDKNLDSAIFSTLLSNNYSIIKSFDMDILYKPVNTHPDMQIHFVADDYAICEPNCYEYYKKALPSHIKLKAGNKISKGTYPYDIAYNVARIGEYVFCNEKYTDSVILNFYDYYNYKIININQGYAKCNMCIVSDKAVITEDIGIYKTIKNTNIDCLLIQPGNIILKGFPHGFIGGASGFIDNRVLFYGSICKHPNAEIIIKFLEKYEVNYTELTNNKLVDFGSIVNVK